MKATAKTAWVGIFLPLVLCFVGGCAELQEIISPGGLAGLVTPKVTQRKLIEPDHIPEAETYAAPQAYRTMDVPVKMNVPDRELDFAVTCVWGDDLLGTRYIPATLGGGAIVEREFENVCDANFRRPVGGEAPVAMFSVRIHSAEICQSAVKAPVQVNLRMNIEIAKPDESETAYSQTIEATANGEWKKKTDVPDAFYQALHEVIRKFLIDWDRSPGVEALARWNRDEISGVVPPKLKSIEWASEGRDVQRGRCTIVCNGWEGFRTKHWANEQIAVACRTRLGDIEPERLRVVYDGEDFNAARGEWTFSFRCFARNAKMLDFNSVTGQGTIIGDLGLLKMNAEEAARVLKAYALKEMQSHSGIVTSTHQGGEAFVRFDDYKTDKTYNLITIDFRLLQ